MAVFTPASKVVIKVEINLGAFGWVDITHRGRAASCVIRQGRSANAKQAESSRLDLTLGNPDGYLTEGNANSPWYGTWGRGCEIRVSRIGLTVSPAERFHGQVDTIEEVFPGGNLDATVEVTAVGTLGILGRGSDPLKSPMTRGIPLDNPLGWWPLERNEKSGLTGGEPMIVNGQVNFGANSGHPGSDALPDYTGGGQLLVRLPNGSVSSSFRIEFTARFGTGFDTISDADFTVPLHIKSASGNVNVWEFLVTTGLAAFQWQDTSGAYVDILLTNKQVDDGQWHHFRADVAQSGGNIAVSLTIDGTVCGTSTLVGKTLNSTDSLLIVNPNADTAGYVGAVGQITWWSPHTPTSIDTAVLATGYSGERAATRMARLCSEEGIGFVLTGSASDTPAMGPQLIDTMLANLRDCENADQGLMHDNGTNGAIGYVTLTHLYNQTATIAVTRGALEPDFRAIRDNQYIRNDVTSQRPNGGSVHVADEDHVTLIRARLKDSRTPNVQTDAQLGDDAAWAVHVGTAPGARYNQVGINLRNTYGALLADSVAAHAIGDRFTAATTALPPQHTDAIDGLTVGWTEYLDADTWRFRANLMPYSPYQVAVYDANRYHSRSSSTTNAITASATTMSVAWDYGDVAWITGNAAPVFPLHVGCEGEKIRVSQIKSTDNDEFSRTVSNGFGTSSDGHTYTTSGTASDFSVTTVPFGHALVIPSATGSDRLAYFTLADDGDRRVLEADLQLDSLPGTGDLRMGVIPRLVDTSNHLIVNLSVATTGQITIRLDKRTGGTLAAVTSISTPVFLQTGNNDYTLKVQVDGSRIAAVVFKTSLGQSTGWMLDTTDSSVLTGSGCGIYVRNASAATGAQFGIGAFRVISPQVFTISRAVNGVSKAHAAGAKVDVWEPSAYAH